MESGAFFAGAIFLNGGTTKENHSVINASHVAIREAVKNVLADFAR